MKTWWMRAGAGLLGVLLSCTAQSQGETGRMSRKDAGDLVAQLIEDVETHALPPIDPAVQAQAKETLVRAVASDSTQDVDRATVYAAARLYLLTIDSDGHSFLWSRQYSRSFIDSTRPAAAVRADVARIVRAGSSDVLVVRPPQTTFFDARMAHDYAAGMTASIEAALAGAKACAVVVDLSDQRGGNAWPPAAVLGGLLTPANRARVEDRWGQRLAVIAPEVYVSYRDLIGPLPADPLAPFAGTGVAYVIEPGTASAGEMLAVTLSGEPSARSFGRPSYGKATSNASLFLADGAQLVLTVGRYALDGQPAIRGPLEPDSPAEAGETLEQTIQRAATWSAAHSPLCRAH